MAQGHMILTLDPRTELIDWINVPFLLEMNVYS